VAVIAVVLSFAYVPEAKADTSDTRLISEAQIIRSIKPLVRDVERAREKDPEVNLFAIESFVRLYDTFPGSHPDEFSRILKVLKKLDTRYAENNAYLYVSSYIVANVLETPDSFSEEESKALTKFLDTLPENHGSVGRLQKMRVMNVLLEDYPGLADIFYEHLDAEELLVFNTGISQEYNIESFPGDEEYEEVGGDPLAPLFGEPSLDSVDAISRLLTPEENRDRFEWAEDVVSVARYQYFKGKNPTRQSVQAAQKTIEKERERWRNNKFLNDTVLYGATAGEEGRFMDERQVSRIKELSEDVHIFAADEGSGRTSVDARAEFLEAIETTEDPITAILSMHGNDQEVVFQDASGSDEAVLWVDELAEAFAARYAEDPERARTDVLILETCSAGTYGMIFLEQLMDRRMPVPVVMAGGEAGQSTYSQTEGDSEFANRYLFTGEQTIGDLYDNYGWDLRSNPLILVPQMSNPYLPLQVS
jgi:hypothetical protein